MRRTRWRSNRPARAFALMYLSFNSKDLTATQITDYMTRVRAAAACRRSMASATHTASRRPDLRDCASGSTHQPYGGAPASTAADIRNALHRQQFHQRRRPGEGRLHADEHQCAPPRSTNAQAFAQLVITARAAIRWCASAMWPRSNSGPQSVDSSTVFDGLKAVFIGIYATPTANPARHDRQCAQGPPAASGRIAARPRNVNGL